MAARRATPEFRENFAAAHARRRLILTAELEAALRDMRAKGKPIYLCAERLGVAFQICRGWCADLGLIKARGPQGTPL